MSPIRRYAYQMAQVAPIDPDWPETVTVEQDVAINFEDLSSVRPEDGASPIVLALRLKGEPAPAECRWTGSRWDRRPLVLG